MKDDGTPMIFWDDAWAPICGHAFWNNQIGARKFCEKLGYESGQGSKTGGSYPIHAFSIGICRDNDIWPFCTGGNNLLKVQSAGEHCGAGTTSAITINCTGGTEKRKISCGGEWLFIIQKYMHAHILQQYVTFIRSSF